MKVEHKIVLVAVLFGLFMWVLDSAVDYLFFFKGTFMQSLATMVAPHDAYLRVVITIVFPVFGLIIGGVVGKLRRVREALEESERALRDILDFDNVVLTTIPFGIEVVDEKGNILFMNKTMAEMTRRPYLGGKCWEMIRDEQYQCPGCPLKDGIKFGKPECLEVDNVFGRKKFRIIHTGMFYNGREAMLELFQDTEEFKTCRTAGPTEVDIARIRKAVQAEKDRERKEDRG
jgi:PAS domain-containing protein